MKLEPDEWRVLSQRLDDALALAESDRLAWVQGLDGDYPSVKALLADLFAHPASVETADLLFTLPAFAPAAEADWTAGTAVGPYRLLRELGRGGMGAVWLAERTDALVKREVALKLPILAASRQTLAQRFAREREILAPLEHPHIARLYDAGFAADGQPYLALEYVAGEPITAYCDRERLPLHKRIELFRQVLAAVQYAHANLVLHRDLKPSNILVTPQGEIKLLDFGIAKLMADGVAQETALTQLAGRALTLDYAAPEQITGAALTTAADVYALGVVCYELAAGARPYRLKRGSRAEVEEAILAQEVQRPSGAVSAVAATHRSTTAAKLKRQLAGDIDTIILKALRKAPAERYATAEAFAQDLDRYLRGEPVQALPQSAWYRTRKFVGRNKLAFVAGSGTLLVLLAGISITLWEAHVARQESTRANASRTFVDELFASVARSNPGGAAAADTTARQLLDVGSRQLLDATDLDAHVRFDLLQWFAHLNSELDLIESSSALSDRAIALAKDLDGAEGPEVAAALAQKADNVYRAASYVEAGKLAGEALRIAEKYPRETLELRAKMHMVVSNAAFQLDYSKTEEPQRHLEIALDLLRRSGVRSEDRSRAAYYLAWLKEMQHDYAAAEPYYRDGIAAGRENFGERSFIVAYGYENFADMLRKQQRLEEAREAITKALQIYEFVLGPRHGTVAFARTNLALIEAAQGHTARGEELADQALAQAREVFGQDARQTGFPATYAARIKADRGALAAAAEVYDQAIAIFTRDEPPEALTARMLRLELAHVLVALGRLERADEVLSEADAGFAAARDTASVYAVRHRLAHAELAFARGDASAGQDKLAAAAEGLDALAQGTKVDTVLPRFADVAARYQHERPQAQAVLDRLAAAHLLPAEPDGLSVDIGDKARLEVAIGRLYLHAGDVDSARKWLTHAVEFRESIDVPDSLWLADSESALAEALVAAGESGSARELLARAEAIYVATLRK